jgi:glycosyltransferase involved in cell wall biosynthesis
MVLLSIIIPVYNVAQYLTDTLQNVLSQSLTNFKLILVDDGSTDGSAEICDNFAEKDNRVKVIHQKNAGVSAARNTGVDNATGKYIGFVDSDDLIEPNMFETLVNIAENEKAQVVQCCHNRLDTVQNVVVSGEQRKIDGVTFVKELFNYSGGEYTNQVALWSKIYSKDLFDEIKFPIGRTYEDEQETYKLCLKANKIIQIPDELYHYVKRENSIITGISAKKMLDKQLALLDRLDYLPTKLPKVEKECVRSFVCFSESIMCSMYKNEEFNFLQKAIDILLSRKSKMVSYLTKYEKIYYNCLNIKLFRNIILANEFIPIQKILAKLKR